MLDSNQIGNSRRLTRSERVPVSCGECRRRKQKCNQAQPCSNCARRFPPPLCEYIINPAQSFSPKRHSEGTSPYSVTTPPFGLLPPVFAGDEHVSIAGVVDALLPAVSLHLQQQKQWSSTDWGHLPESIVPAPWGNHWQGLGAASFGKDASPSQQVGSTVCQAGCIVHSEAYHSAVLLLGEVVAFPANYVQQWRPEKTDEVLIWLSRQLASNASSLGLASDRMALPFQPTRQDAELLRIFVNFVSRFKATLDGDVDMNSSVYMNRFVPFCLHSPLLIQTAIYTSACVLNEMEGRHILIDNTTAVAHKFRAIRMLNEHLQTHKSTTDEAISAVMQLMLNEWYWGKIDDLKSHTRGLKEMIRLRGGFCSVGLGGLLAKLVIVSDIAIALSFEIQPCLQGSPEFEYRDPVSVPFRVSLNTPLVPSLAPFSRCAEPLHLHPATGQVLDDMRFLVGLVLALPGNPTEKDLQKVKTTSAWIYERICSLPEETPAMQQHRGSAIVPSPASANTCDRRASSSSPCPNKPVYHRSPSDPHPDPDFVMPEWSPGLAGTTPTQPTSQDIMYQAVRQTALIYARAIMSRKPLADPTVCSQEDFFLLWTSVWKIPLRRWKGVLGVFVWVMISIGPASRRTSHSRYVKSLLTVGITQTGLEDWHVAEKAMRGALTLVGWLAGGT